MGLEGLSILIILVADAWVVWRRGNWLLLTVPAMHGSAWWRAVAWLAVRIVHVAMVSCHLCPELLRIFEVFRVYISSLVASHPIFEHFKAISSLSHVSIRVISPPLLWGPRVKLVSSLVLRVYSAVLIPSSWVAWVRGLVIVILSLELLGRDIIIWTALYPCKRLVHVRIGRLLVLEAVGWGVGGWGLVAVVVWIWLMGWFGVETASWLASSLRS
jgi:hypothetical protein